MGSEPKRSMPERPSGMVATDDIDRTKAARGQNIVRSFGRDDSSYEVPNTHGREMKGGVNNLAHSLSGASAVQDNK